MNKLYIILSAGLILILNSCYKDLGNYDYSAKEEITVTGIDASYSKISLVDKLTITPSVVSSIPDADFEYRWGIYETAVQGTAPKVDTIGRALALDYPVNQPAKTWVLIFYAKNKKTGLSKIVTSSVEVITQFTRGWYVLKDDGSKSDLDLFLTPKTIIPESKLENVYSLANGKKLDGKATHLVFYSDYKSTANGTLGNTRAMFLVTNKDASVVNINTIKEIRNLGTLFYESPSVKLPSFICNGAQAQFFVNDNQLYSIYAMSSNIGVFGAKQLIDNVNTPYKLSKYYMTYWISDPTFFDELSSSFVSAGGAGTVMNKVTQTATSSMPANKNNKTLLYMGIKNASPYSGVAVFQDKTISSQKILSELSGTASAFVIKNDTLKTTDKIYSATNYTLNYVDESMIYFVTGNQVWSRNLANKFEQLQFTAPAGEEITFIRHRKYTTTTEPLFAYNYVMVGTKNGTNYTVRMFTKTSGNLSATPAVTLTGNGSVADVLYIAPAIGGSTYPNSF